MSIRITPRSSDHSDFAGEINGVNIRNGVTAAEANAIEEAIDHYAVLVFHGRCRST